MTPKEAFEILVKNISISTDYETWKLLTEDSKYPLKQLEEYKLVTQALTELEKYLTPPTQDEVCKAIHGDTALKTFYKNGEFIFSGLLSYAIYNDGEKIILSKMLRDNCTLETFELISRYYKGESK